MQKFFDLPCDYRLKIRQIIEDNCGLIEGYTNRGIQTILPSDAEKRKSLITCMHEHGMQPNSDSRFWFPACNNEPAHALRWKNVKDAGNRCAAYVEYCTFELI